MKSEVGYDTCHSRTLLSPSSALSPPTRPPEWTEWENGPPVLLLTAPHVEAVDDRREGVEEGGRDVVGSRDGLLQIGRPDGPVVHRPVLEVVHVGVVDDDGVTVHS